MENEFKELRTAIDNLEFAVLRNEDEDIDMYVRQIKNISNNIKNVYWKGSEQIETVTVTPSDSKKIYRTINTIEFLIKPMAYVDVYEGNVLERFSDERAEELRESKALEAHNNFWKENEIIFGNVYGSVPVEFLETTSMSKLLRCGWKKVEVDILDFTINDKEEILKTAESKFKSYILIFEKETSEYLLLKYKI